MDWGHFSTSLYFNFEIREFLSIAWFFCLQTAHTFYFFLLPSLFTLADSRNVSNFIRLKAILKWLIFEEKKILFLNIKRSLSVQTTCIYFWVKILENFDRKVSSVRMDTSTKLISRVLKNWIMLSKLFQLQIWWHCPDLMGHKLVKQAQIKFEQEGFFFKKLLYFMTIDILKIKKKYPNPTYKSNLAQPRLKFG